MGASKDAGNQWVYIIMSLHGMTRLHDIHSDPIPIHISIRIYTRETQCRVCHVLR